MTIKPTEIPSSEVPPGTIDQIETGAPQATEPAEPQPSAAQQIPEAQAALQRTEASLALATHSIEQASEQLAQIRTELGLQPEEVLATPDKLRVEQLESRQDELQAQEEHLRAQRVGEILSPEDNAVFQHLIESIGGVENLFNPKGKFLHTTENLSFGEILSSGIILTDDVFPGGKQRTPGASFTDGNFPETASFQLVYDNVASGGKEKRLRSDQYAEALGGTPTEDFVRYFWNNQSEVAKPYFADLAKKIPDAALANLGISADRTISTEEQALAIGKFFVPKSKGDFGVTIVYDGAKQDEIGIEDRGTTGLQKFFEKKSFKKGGVSLSEASMILVPESRITEVKQTLADHGLTHVDVRATEELEARRMMQKVAE